MSPTRRVRIGASGAALALAFAATAALALATTSARGAPHSGVQTLRSTMFAAQVGSLTNGGEVFAGSVVDRTRGHGAIVITATGSSLLDVTFQDFFARGSISGRGEVALAPAADGGETLTGTLRVTSGTGRYAGAHGRLRTNGTLAADGQIVATIRGSFRR
jgi:hypothetical protein